MKVFQINHNTTSGNPSFLQIAIIGELQTTAENEEEVFDALNGEYAPHTTFSPSKEWRGYVNNDVVFFNGQQWCSWHPLTGELRKHSSLNDTLEELVADIKYLIKLRYIDFN